MAITVGCKACDWLTDIELISDTNPHRCPQCGKTIYLSAGTELGDDPLFVDGEYNPCLYEGEDTDEDYGTLCDYYTGAAYWAATREQRDASRAAAVSDGGAGVIAVNNRGRVLRQDETDGDSIICYVED